MTDGQIREAENKKSKLTFYLQLYFMINKFKLKRTINLLLVNRVIDLSFEIKAIFVIRFSNTDVHVLLPAFLRTDKVYFCSFNKSFF